MLRNVPAPETLLLLNFATFPFRAGEGPLANSPSFQGAGCLRLVFWGASRMESGAGVEEGCQFTTFCVLPSRKERTFSTAIFIRRARAARVAHARCGVMRQFLAVSNGLSARGGSVDSTS